MGVVVRGGTGAQKDIPHFLGGPGPPWYNTRGNTAICNRCSSNKEMSYQMDICTFTLTDRQKGRGTEEEGQISIQRHAVAKGFIEKRS